MHFINNSSLNILNIKIKVIVCLMFNTVIENYLSFIEYIDFIKILTK